MMFELWLYDNGNLKSCLYFKADNFEKLLIQLEEFSENGKYTYKLLNGSNSRVRKKTETAKTRRLISEKFKNE